MQHIKKIIIPNDFSVKSLTLLRKVLESTDEKYEIILLHGIAPSNAFTDLLYFRKGKLIEELISDEFDQALSMLKNKFANRFQKIYFDIIISSNRNYFNDYITANNVDAIFVPEDIELDLKHKRSFALAPVFDKCDIPVKRFRLLDTPTATSFLTNDIADLFLPSIAFSKT